MLVRSVTIETANPGGLSTTQTATATVGDAASTDSGTFTYREERTVTAEVSGKVSALSTAEGRQISSGQAIAADAVKDKTYRGTVTKVSVAGTSSGSATTYPVTIRIDETDGLLPGMSVDASIELDSASDVLSIPAAALSRGNTVLVTADSPSAAIGTPAEEGGYVSVPVTVGVISSDYMEITSGLQEGDTVAYIPTSSSDDMFSPGDWGGGGMHGPGGSMGGF